MSSDTESENGDYTTSPLWSDIHPIPQDDGPTPLAQIAYRPEYTIAMSYLRAVMAKNEISERVLGLTGDVIRMNPAHYTVWSFRFKCLLGLSRLQEEERKKKKKTSGGEGSGSGNVEGTEEKEKVVLRGQEEDDDKSTTVAAGARTTIEGLSAEHKDGGGQTEARVDVEGTGEEEEGRKMTSSSTKDKFERNYWLEELAYTTQIALIYEKNYQIWHHRQLIVDHLSLASRTNPDGISLYNERTVTQSMFDKDSKNYHVWTYRQWLVGRFGLFDDGVEETFTKEMIEKDVKNNSAWNHRFFVMFGGVGSAQSTKETVQERVKRELTWVGDMVERAPQNASVWNYLKGYVNVFPSFTAS